MATASVVALLSATPAFAQTTPPPATTPPASVQSTTPPAQVQAPGTIDVQKLIGRNVVNAQNETISEIESVIIGADGKIHQVILGVGGFLGIGARDVAVRYESLQVSRDDPNNMKVNLNVTKDTLQSAPEYKAKPNSDLSGEKKQ